jgi:hypothetical protein
MFLCRILRSFSTGKSIAFTTFHTAEKYAEINNVLVESPMDGVHGVKDLVHVLDDGDVSRVGARVRVVFVREGFEVRSQ